MTDVNESLNRYIENMAGTQPQEQQPTVQTQPVAEQPQAATAEVAKTDVLENIDMTVAEKPKTADVIETTDPNTGLPLLKPEIVVDMPPVRFEEEVKGEITMGDYIPDKLEVGGRVVDKKNINIRHDGIMKGLAEKQELAEAKLARLQEQAATGEIPNMLPVDSESGDAIESLLASMTDEKKKEDVGISEDDDIATMLDKMEAEKTFTSYVPNEEVYGPAAYTIENQEYVEAVEEVLDFNNIKLIKKSGGERNAILDRFTNSGNEVSMIFPNSSIFIKVTGAGSGELVAMANIKANKPSIVELSKLKHVSEHIVGSSIGRMTLKHLIKVVSNKDKDTLYYALYAATYPDESELNRTCSACGAEFYEKVKTKDLLLNPEDFKDKVNLVSTSINKFEDLVKASALGKEKVLKHSTGMLVYFKHASISDYITSLDVMTRESLTKYENLIDIAYNINKLGIPDPGNKGKYIPITDPNEILIVLSKLKSVQERFEIIDMINELRATPAPIYGFQECTCPHCGAKNTKLPFSMEQLLFYQAQKEEEMETLRWTARQQEKKKVEDKSSKN